MNRIPPDAFEFYASLGQERSYRAVAKEYGVSKRAVTKKAAVEGWTDRLEAIEAKVREKSDEKLAETMEEMRSRHLKTLRAMSSRALSGLKEFPLSSGMEAIKAAELTIKLERLITGEPSERRHLSIEEVTRRELETLLIADDDFDDGESEGESSGEYDEDDQAPSAG
jgi:hypothetical protein